MGITGAGRKANSAPAVEAAGAALIAAIRNNEERKVEEAAGLGPCRPCGSGVRYSAMKVG